MWFAIGFLALWVVALVISVAALWERVQKLEQAAPKTASLGGQVSAVPRPEYEQYDEGSR